MRKVELGHVTMIYYSRAEGDDHDGHTAVHHTVIPGELSQDAIEQDHD